MRRVIHREGQAPEILPDTRIASSWGAHLIAVSKRECERNILAVAPLWRQINAARGVYDEPTTTTLFAQIDDIRTAQNAHEAAIQAILADAGLDDAGKLAALDAL